MNGEVGLRPAALLAELANSSAEPTADIGCHRYSMAVFFERHFAYRRQSLAFTRQADESTAENITLVGCAGCVVPVHTSPLDIRHSETRRQSGL